MTALRSIVDSRPANRHIRYAAVVLSVVVAGIHLFHRDRGLPRLVDLLWTNNAALLVTDPRPLLFVLSAAAILAGIALVLWGYPRQPIYLAGMVLVGFYVGGYFAWHMTGHGGFLPGRLPHFHGLSPVEAVVRHLELYPVARVSKVAELLLLAVLAVLYRRETDTEPELEPEPALRNQ